MKNKISILLSLAIALNAFAIETLGARREAAPEAERVISRPQGYTNMLEGEIKNIALTIENINSIVDEVNGPMQIDATHALNQNAMSSLRERFARLVELLTRVVTDESLDKVVRKDMTEALVLAIRKISIQVQIEENGDPKARQLEEAINQRIAWSTSREFFGAIVTALTFRKTAAGHRVWLPSDIRHRDQLASLMTQDMEKFAAEVLPKFESTRARRLDLVESLGEDPQGPGRSLLDTQIRIEQARYKAQIYAYRIWLGLAVGFATVLPIFDPISHIDYAVNGSIGDWDAVISTWFFYVLPSTLFGLSKLRAVSADLLQQLRRTKAMFLNPTETPTIEATPLTISQRASQYLSRLKTSCSALLSR
jgi:hypothetical protein